MKVLKFIALLLCSCTLFCSCGEAGEEADPLTRAEMAFSAKNTAEAQAICDSLYVSDQFDKMSTQQRCRLALLFYRIADSNSEEARMATAAECLQSAIKLQRDSVEAYINGADIEDRSQLILISQLCDAVDDFADGKFVLTEDYDSAYIYDEHPDE
jgi:hypothetical protein